MPVAWNLDLSSDRMTPWSVLRSLADQCDVIHRCIEIRTSEITSLERSHTVDDVAIKRIMVEQNVSHALAIADRAFVLETGRVTLSGPARELARDRRVQDSYLGFASA